VTEALRQMAPIPGHPTTLASMARHAGDATAESASLSRRNPGIWKTASTPHPFNGQDAGAPCFFLRGNQGSANPSLGSPAPEPRFRFRGWKPQKPGLIREAGGVHTPPRESVLMRSVSDASATSVIG
jgi:hypothetical protein